MLTICFMPAPSLPSESRMRSNVVRTSCSNVTLPLSGGNGTPTWPEMKIQEPARVSMRNASLKVGAIGLGRCLRRSMAVLPTILLFSPPRRVRAPRRAHFCRSALALAPPPFGGTRSCSDRANKAAQHQPPRIARARFTELHRAALGEYFTAMRQYLETTKFDRCRHNPDRSKLSGPDIFRVVQIVEQRLCR